LEKGKRERKEREEREEEEEKKGQILAADQIGWLRLTRDKK
jgi:hypothetical protein